MSSFLDDIEEDLNQSFFNVEEFGENLTLVRGSQSYVIQGLFDTPQVPTDSVGIEVDGITHYNRLFVRQKDLPDGKPKKGDKFVLSASNFHSALTLVALDYVFEKDGCVVYRCKDSR